jgi:hypothetical protein
MVQGPQKETQMLVILIILRTLTLVSILQRIELLIMNLAQKCIIRPISIINQGVLDQDMVLKTEMEDLWAEVSRIRPRAI